MTRLTLSKKSNDWTLKNHKIEEVSSTPKLRHACEVTLHHNTSSPTGELCAITTWPLCYTPYHMKFFASSAIIVRFKTY